MFAPGSKPLLYAIVQAMPGGVILPRPAWVSYAAQAALAGKRVLRVQAADGAGGVPDPDQLAYVLAGLVELLAQDRRGPAKGAAP